MRVDFITVAFTEGGKNYAYKAPTFSGLKQGDVVVVKAPQNGAGEFEAAVVQTVMEFREEGGEEERFLEHVLGQPIKPIYGSVREAKWT